MAKIEEVEGFEIPLHRSLTEPILMAGAPRNFTLGNFALMILIAGYYYIFYLIPLHFIAQGVAVLLTKNDPQYFSCFWRYLWPNGFRYPFKRNDFYVN